MQDVVIKKRGRKPMDKTAQLEMDKLENQFNKFQENITDLTLDRMNEAPKLELEPQTKMSQKEIEKSKDIYLKPNKSIAGSGKFNEKFRDSYNFDKTYVHFTAENKEIIGDNIECWTRPYPGMPAEFWKVPVNVPIWGPRYLAEQLRRKSYHRLVMKENVSAGSDGLGQWFGSMAVDTTVPRLTAEPVSTRKSIFMGAEGF